MVAIESQLKEGNRSIETSDGDLFDKIINLRFIRRSNTGFTIRSDYEPVRHKDGTVSFKVCTQKPDIKVEYKQVAQATAIELDIRVSNFYISEALVGQDIDKYSGDPVQWCIIQMGYRKQFPDWTKEPRCNNVQRFFDLNNNDIDPSEEVHRGNQLMVRILTGYPESYPPDAVLYFKGIVGSVDTGLKWNHTEAQLVRGYGNQSRPNGLSWLEETLYQLVSRRFIKSSVIHKSETVRDFTNTEAIQEILDRKYEQQISVFTHGDPGDPGARPEDRLLSSDRSIEHTNASEEGSWTPLTLEDGLMSTEDTNKYGVICAMSLSLRLLPEPTVVTQNGTRVPAAPFARLYDTIGGQLSALRQQFPYLRWFILSDGSYFFYHVDDTDKDLWADPIVRRLRRKKPVYLPAIYDMSPDQPRKIRCPFISFVSPTMTVIFQTRHSIGTFIGYFSPIRTNAFQVIFVDVKFATVQDENVMELTVIDRPPEEPEYDEEIEEPEDPPPEIPEVVVMQQERNLRWRKYTIAVVTQTTRTAEFSFSRFSNIVDIHYMSPSSINREGWIGGAVPTEKKAIELILEDNQYLADRARSIRPGSDEDSIENRPGGIGHRTGIRLPWIFAGEKIVIRTPFQSEYPADQEETV